MLSYGFTLSTAAPEVLEGCINYETSFEDEEMCGLLHDPQKADIFSMCIVILFLLGGKHPVAWTPPSLQTEDSELEDMEEAVHLYSDPIVSPTSLYSHLHYVCTAHQLEPLSRVLYSCSVSRLVCSLRVFAPRTEPNLASISTRCSVTSSKLVLIGSHIHIVTSADPSLCHASGRPLCQL